MAVHQGPPPTPPPLERIEYLKAKPPRFDKRGAYGILGEIAMTLHRYTGLDFAGLYRCLQNAVGCVLGPNITVRLDNGPPQQAHLGDVLVGETAVGKDRMYLAVLDHVMIYIDPTWRAERFFENVRSDAAIVHLVHDDIVDAGGAVKVMGVVDTRTWMVEREFSRLLKDMKRPDAALSEQVRKSLDGPYLGNTTKTTNLNERATRAHISWIGLTTPTDLAEHLDSSSIANGLANRFRYTFVQEGAPSEHGDLDAELEPLIHKLDTAIKQARAYVGGIPLADDVEIALRRLDRGVKQFLRPEGLAGDLEARFLLHVMRESLILAVLEPAPIIEVQKHHLVPALINRLHVTETNHVLFSGKTGSGLADEVLRTLVRQAPETLSLSALNSEFSNNLRAGQLRSALNLLATHGLIEGYRGHSTAKGGRRPELWRATDRGLGQGGSSIVSSSIDRRLRVLLNPSDHVVANGPIGARRKQLDLHELLTGPPPASDIQVPMHDETMKLNGSAAPVANRRIIQRQQRTELPGGHDD